MRMFTLLTTLLLLALHTQAGSHQGSSEEAPDQEQLVKEDQDISTSFGMDKCSTLQDADVKSDLICDCRLTDCCFGQRLSGASTYQGHTFQLCCHLALRT
ncbi:neutrophil antibiotic peptide NP-2-like [Mus musculus]|uniref:neutrophil antibiotic peptide NP-2-like n=1 Tax=Mus musculus TaxID=10090 RepID=UPI0011AE5324|nr:neutrophil antibiotic peptide NP-2-like [Mus musculus]XP_030099773.1 neutrophil antibiotic peptide NP-2-like [Mus musculus]